MALDVYKRQTLNHAQRAGRHGCGANRRHQGHGRAQRKIDAPHQHARGLAPVSYTHLDVYKRQTPAFE